MRDQIIKEIQRIARENDGAAPGKRKFEQLTGIRESAWSGRIWARWGDALREAGFEPKKFQVKSSEDLVLRKLAEAFQFYGKVPTMSELRMYRNQDQSFPYHNTLSNHFNTKAQMIARLRSWVSNTDGFQDVLGLIPPSQEVSRNFARKYVVEEGYVYLLRSGDHFKIGRSEEIERRIKEIRIALPEAVKLEHTIKTDDPPGIEAYWHRRFADKRLNGEWFKLSPGDVHAFKRRKFQ